MRKVSENILNSNLAAGQKNFLTIFLFLPLFLCNFTPCMRIDSSDISIRQAQGLVDQWIKTVGVRYFSPLTNMAVLCEETGEVARAMARIYGDQSAKPGENIDLADELADVMWVVMAIANQTGVDLDLAFRCNIEKKSERDALRHKRNPKLSEQKEN